MKNIAVILAGGTGSRIGGELPKQFVEVVGSPVIAYSIDAFEKHTGIDEIAVVIPPAYRKTWDAIAEKYNWKKVNKILEGGRQRSDSTLSALQAYWNLDEANILFHDAVRPLVSRRIIDDTLCALEHYAAVAVAVAITDTILQTDDAQQIIANIPSRSLLRRMQTPQGFKLSVIRKAYALAMADPDFVVSDDCGVVHQYLPDVKTGLVEGDERNFKITWPQDFQLMESLHTLIDRNTQFV
jgi:2-C-methyl-D-erythritol 4-phosphate cytidylyltransferase